MITDHPYLDNNGPTYRYGGCAPDDGRRCGKPVEDHTKMVTADGPRARRRIVAVVK